MPTAGNTPLHVDVRAAGAADAEAPRVMIIDDEVSAARVGRSALVIEADAARTCTAAVACYTEDRMESLAPGIYLEAGGDALMGGIGAQTAARCALPRPMRCAPSSASRLPRCATQSGSGSCPQ